MQINEINTINNFNTILFCLNCIVSYKYDLFVYILKYSSLITQINQINNFCKIKFLNTEYNKNNQDVKHNIDILENIYLKIINDLCMLNIDYLVDMKGIFKLCKNEYILKEIFLINIGSEIKCNKEQKCNPYIYLFPNIHNNFYEYFAETNHVIQHLKKFQNYVHELDELF